MNVASTLRKGLRASAPHPLLRLARLLGEHTARRRHHGDAVLCPICGSTWGEFAPFAGRSGARCPSCRSLERHRLLWLFLHAETDLFRRRQRVLHIAPEPHLRAGLRALHGRDYVSGDLADPANRLDVTALDFPDGAFDVVLCSHVLEHVPDDARAMGELRRVLAPTGWAVLDAPVDERRAVTLEDPSATSRRQRARRFGQWDHVRVYGRDYVDRLRDAGFEVTVDPFVLEPEQARRHGLRPGKDRVYLCSRE